MNTVRTLVIEGLLFGVVFTAFSLLSGCSENNTTGPDSDTVALDLADWTETTHGSSVSPNYEEVFSDGTVRRVDIVIAESDWQDMIDDMTANYGQFGGGGPDRPPVFGSEDPIWVPCSFYYNGIEWYQVGVRFKGNSSLMSAWEQGIGKLSLKLDFDQYEDDYPQILNQRFFGFRQLNLGNNFDDQSLIREKATSEIFRAAGLPVAHTSFCRVYVDHGNGPVYFGLYTIIEEVDDTVIDDQFDNGSGNLYKPEGTGAAFAFGTFSQLSFEKKSNEYTSDWSDIQQLFAALHSSDRLSNPEVWRNTLDTVFDVSGFLKWLAINTVIQNWDSYGIMAHNYYLYHDPDSDLLTWITWDHNEALQDGKQGGALSLSLGEVNDSWPLIRYLIDDSVYSEAYCEQIRYTIDSVFVPSRWAAQYQDWHDLIAPYVTGSDGEIAGYTFLSSAADFDNALSFLKSHVSGRQAAAASYLGSR